MIIFNFSHFLFDVLPLDALLPIFYFFFFQMNMDVSPYEAGLDFFIKLNKVINVSLTITKKYFLLMIARLILV